MDESGKNVFFTTRDQLTLKDKDELIDLYDAREDGGIPAETEVARTECQGEACQAPGLAGGAQPRTRLAGSGNVRRRRQTSQGKKRKAKKHAKKHKKKHKQESTAHKRAAKHNRGGAK